MDRSEFRPYTMRGLLIPRHCYPFNETLSFRVVRRTSQVPRLIFRHAPSPITPDSPTGSYTRLSPASGRLHHFRKVGRCQVCVTRPNRVRLRWARVFVVRVVNPSPSPSWREPALLPTVGYPHVTGRDYMLNEQFTCLTPFSQIDQPGLAWRTRGHRGKGWRKNIDVWFTPKKAFLCDPPCPLW
jgi:hypothetical protein